MLEDGQEVVLRLGVGYDLLQKLESALSISKQVSQGQLSTVNTIFSVFVLLLIS